jgi:creatinine amidohydrolase
LEKSSHQVKVKVMDANELYDPEFRKLIKSKKLTVIIPVGSIEQHGAHLPITTDSDIVTEIASRLAKKCGFIVFPTVNYGISEEHDPFFNISLSKQTVLKILKDIDRSLRKNKSLMRIIFLNGHHGNVESLKSAWKYWGMTDTWAEVTRSYSYWHWMKHEFDHAGFVETSLMLAISDKVKMKKAKKGFTTKGLSKKEIRRISKLSTQPGGFPKVAKNGVWGDPTGATKKDGEKFLAEIVRNLAKECQS